jgi:tripartite-type tricarboxylate transporter receptor subunit TctC
MFISKKWLALVAALAMGASAHAADVVKLVVPFAPGGPVDGVARIIAAQLSAELGQSVLVDNRGGAGGTIGANYVAKSAPDGNTILVATSGYVMSVGTTPNLPYDPRRDLTPVALFGQVQTLLVVRNSLNVKTAAELVAKVHAGAKLTYGSSGVGSTMHIGGELFNIATHGHIVHVPYRGAGPALIDLIAGRLDMVNADIPVLQAYVKDKRITPIVVYDTKRSPFLPDVPDATEAGLPDLSMSNWYGALVPAATPPARRAQLEAALLKTLANPSVAEKLKADGLSGPMNTADFTRKFNADLDRWVPFIQKAGIRAE